MAEIDPAQAALAGAALLALTGLRWWSLRSQLPPHQRSASRAPGVRTSTCGVNLAALVGGVAVSVWAAPHAVALATTAAVLPPVALHGPAVLSGAVVAAGVELGCRALGFWPAYTCPKLLHAPALALLPVVLVAGGPLIGHTLTALLDRTPEAQAAAAAVPVQTVACQGGVPVGEIHGWKGVQLVNASEIVAAGQEMGAPEQAIVTAVATGMQEASLLDLANPRVPESLALPHDGRGDDHDSIGVMQQRPSMGWGAPSALMDTRQATRIFLERLLALPGWESMPLTQAAQTVQRSAHPERYARHEDAARAVVAAVTTTCTPN